MITKSNPFLRNDYYPDQNDIDELNTRINEVQSDVDLLAISVNEKTEAVNGRLNTLQNDYNESFETESLKSNLADFNVLNVNVQATIKDLDAEDTYTENLIVNKPVQDLALRNPHLENATSVNGNFYEPKIIGGKIDNIQFENIQNFKAINIEADEVKANKLIGDFSSTEPISSSAAVGYDENGRLIPIKASYDVSFPEDSDYLRTDAQGIARKGTSESEVVQSTNLIQAGAVQNMYDAVIESFNDVNNHFSNVELSFNNVDNNFNDINNSFNEINSFVNNSFNEVNSFVNDGFNDVNNYVNNSINNVNQVLADMASLLNIVNTLIPASFSNANKYNLKDLGFSNVQRIEFVTPADTTGTNISTGPSNPVYLKFDDTTNTLKYTSDVLVINETMFRAFNANIGSMFLDCTKFNQNIYIPDNVTDVSSTFRGCSSLNQNIQIPNGITNMFFTFCNCSSLNQNIQIPNGLHLIDSAFGGCTNLNQNILIPNTVTNMKDTFSRCTSLNQNILIPNTAVKLFATFWGCSSLNQNILIPPSATSISQIFFNCTNMNQDVYIYSQNINAGGMLHAFINTNIRNIHIPTSVPKDTTNYMYNCLVNGSTGITFTADRIFNDLPVDIDHWPPENV